MTRACWCSGFEGLPLRGHGDETDLNFFQLLKLRSVNDTRILNWLERIPDKYVAPDMQNEIIKIMALQVLQQVANSLHTAPFFGYHSGWECGCVQQGATCHRVLKGRQQSWRLCWALSSRIYLSICHCNCCVWCLAKIEHLNHKTWRTVLWWCFVHVWISRRSSHKNPWSNLAQSRIHTLLWPCPQIGLLQHCQALHSDAECIG